MSLARVCDGDKGQSLIIRVQFIVGPVRLLGGETVLFGVRLVPSRLCGDSLSSLPSKQCVTGCDPTSGECAHDP